jgi:hypothetical protein
MAPEQENQLFLMIGEIKAMQAALLDKFEQHIEDDKILAQDVKELNMKVNKAAAVLTLVTIFITAVFQSGLKKLGLIS